MKGTTRNTRNPDLKQVVSVNCGNRSIGANLNHGPHEHPVVTRGDLLLEGLAEAWRRDGQHRELLADVEGNVREKEQGCLW